MKKLFFMAAIAGVALVSCVKNEMDPSTKQQDEITFSTPVVAPATKAIVDGVVYPTTESFGVYAWHNTAADAYMNEVQVSYTAGLADDVTGETAGENGGWKPATSYYWPKEGSLVFDAFSPWSVNGLVSATKADGLTITDFVVAAAADVDLMFATRTAEKTNVNDGANADVPYDGVDIAFNHALSAVQVMAKTASDYAGTTIAITSIQINNADSKGTFNQNVGSTAAWATTSTPAVYAYTGATLTATAQDLGTKLLLPQAIDADLTITINYTINGLAQTSTFKFADHKNGTDEGDSPVIVNAWEMGNKYVYTLVFTLDEIFFEPIVTDWETITVA